MWTEVLLMEARHGLLSAAALMSNIPYHNLDITVDDGRKISIYVMYINA